MEKRINTLIISLLVILCLIQGISLIYYYNENNNESITQPVKNIINTYEVTGYSTDFTRVSEKLDDYLVEIKYDDLYKTGVIYYYSDNVATIITSHNEALEYTITFPNGISYTTQPIKDENNDVLDIFLIQLDFEVTPIAKGNSDLLKPGEFILSRNQNLRIQYQDETQVSNIRNNKIISEKDAYAKISDSFYSIMQGTPVVNQNNEMIGLYINNQKDLFLLNNNIQIIVDTILDTNYLSKYKLLIDFVEVKTLQTYQKNNLAINLSLNKGLYIIDIKEESLLKDIIKIGDIITKINEIEIKDVYDYQKAMIKVRANDTIKIEYYRNNKKDYIEILVQ